MQKQKTIGGIVVLLVLFAQSFANWVIFSGGDVQAAGPVEENKLVALFVEQNIYPTIKNDIERYTTTYIQSRFERTKVLVFPLDTTKIQPADIQKILANLYHGGEKDTPSSLISTILVGNIPLPVIKKEQYIFPSILPYTDIEKPLYVYDTTSSYYIPTSATPDNHQELSHGLIKFSTVQEYTNYFQKLKSYAQNPSSFAQQQFWFEDFTKAEETFTDQNVPLYIQSQIHDEDITYHRYAPVLFSMLQKNNNDTSLETLQNIGVQSIPSSPDYPAEFASSSQEFNSSLSTWSNTLSTIASDAQQQLQGIGNGEQIPTLVMGQSIIQQTKPYESLFSAEYGDIIAKEIETSTRWTGTNIGSHITKASTVDQQTSRALLGINTLLEKVIDKKIQDESWDVNVPIPVVREQYKCILGIPTTLEYKLENFYFGKNARHINNASQTTWYRGTFGNYTLDTVLGVARGGQQLDSTNSLQRSIGSSMGITNQQVVASRGYNATNAKSDADAYEYRKKKCGRNDVPFEKYVEQFRGGNTPINLDGNTMQLKYNKWDQAFNPTYNTGIGGALFDIAGSRLVPSEIVDGTNATAARTYGRFLQVEPGLTGPLALLFGSAQYPWCNPKNPVPVAGSNFFSIAATPTNKDIQLITSGATTYDDSKTCKDRYVYKTINSIVKHTSPIKEEIDKMNIATKDRPVDAKRYVSFQGLGGTIVNIQYPNLYNVEVYNRDGNSITLKSVDRIEQAIKTYLENKIDEYNILLSGQNALISGYIVANTPGFTLLATKDTKASPVGRQYTILSRDYFINAIGANTIRQLAQSLYVKNSGWPVKSPSSNVGDAIKNLESQFSIANKIYATVENNIVAGQQGIGVNTGGYEAGYIRSNGANTIAAKTAPSLIETADAKIQTTKTSTNELSTNSDKQQAAIDQSCGISGDGTVPLLKWPKALVCRWKNLRKVSLKDAIKISYKNAQGPVLPLKQFAGDLKESYADYEAYVQDVLGGDIVEDNTVASITLQLPSTKVIRGAQIPFSAIVKNTKGDEIPNLLFPIEVSVSTGEILSPGQATTRIETTISNDPLVLDTRTIDPSINRVTIQTRGPLEVGRASGDMLQNIQEITLVDGALQIQINNQTTNNFSMILQNSGYTTVNAGVSSIQENLLPTLSLRLTDNSGQPLTSPATIVSEKGLVQPGSTSIIQEQTIVGPINRTQFTKQNLWTITDGLLKVKLLPSMVAGNDVVTISIPGLPDRTIDIKVLPSGPYAVSVTDDTQSNTPAVRIAVQDRWGNTIQGFTQVQYQIIGDATSNGTRQGTVVVSGSSSLPLSYGQRGGIVYVYGSLQTPVDAIPGYLRKDIPSNLWPTTGLNIVYLTLEGKGWGDIQKNTISELISSSPKTLGVTTELFSRGDNLPVVGIIAQDGSVSETNTLKVESDTSNTTRKIITVNNQVIGYMQGSVPHSLSQFVIQNARYAVQQIGFNGSTNTIGFSIVEAGGESLDEKEQDFAPIRSYAGGMTLGESQKILFDESRVNYGDPFLQHKDAMKIIATSADTTVTLFRDDEKTIKKTMEIDLDKDGKKDLVILYDDDTIRFLKQYGGTPPYKQLGNLMAITDGVSDMWIGDSDKNGLEDVFIRTKKNTLRVYKNIGGSFDVHGSPICIDVPSGNTSLQDVWQLFIADMNNDTVADIITYDVSGKIRIFYGGNTNGVGYYISNSPTGCDAGWQARNSSLTVATYGLQLVQNTPIYDDSLIHRQGLTLPDNAEEDEENNDIVPANIAQALPNPNNPTSINLQQLIGAGIPETIRFTATPYDQLPVYEANGSLDTIAYIPIQYLTGNDIVDAYKTFVYGQGDEVIVTVTLRARQNTIATYLEQLRGPREITKNDSGAVSGFNRINLPTSSIVNWNIDGYEFLVDNIALSVGQSVSFSYPVRYRPVQSTTIDVRDTNSDGWLDITTTPVDSCMPTSLTYVSNQGTTYTSTSETINTSYTSGINQLQSDINSQLQNTNTIGQNLANGSGSISQIPGMEQAYETRHDFLQNGVDTTTMSFNANFDLNVLNDPKIEKAIDDVVKGLCQGFQAEGGKGLPVPFNMAFLAPGDFNVFGCKVGSDKGLPVFFFPGTMYVMGAPVPIPYGLKSPTDGFYRAGGGTIPSFIRIYAAPTLTMGIGVAICIGPYAAGIRLPNPIKHIAGNCIVIAKRLGKGKDRPYQTPSHPNNTANGGGTNTAGATDNSRTCTNPVASTTRPSSPFTMSAYNGARDLPIRPAPVNNTQPLGIVQGTYLGIVNFDTQPYATQLSQQSASNVQIKGGKPFKLQIEGGNVKGLVKCIINKWLDNQLRYVINNLSNMSINIYLPDVSQILEGFKNVRLDEINKVAESFKQSPGSNNTPAGNTLKNLVTKAEGDKNTTTQSEMSELGSVMNNPFNALSSWFEQVPLIKVSTRNVTVQIPYIYSEELTRYTAQLKDYKTQIDKQYAERQRFMRDARGVCDKEPTANKKEACNRQIANYVDVTTKMEQLQRSIRQNLSTLEAYKRFPLELQQWLTISQRYVTEITDTVQGISSDITAWLHTNATRFEKYVDAIILMISAIKSWQILIDFSTSWKSKCGQCTVDNYDYYSCTLGLLCPKLPILPIPPFRLPNIYVDLSHIRLGMDVVLPNIHFVPKTITLPALPELPTPPSINVDFTIGAGAKITGSPNIPSIPELPAPPRLPELPSFIPSIDLNLPTLPPAPKVPRLAPAITSTLKVVSLIGKIMCIVKNGIGLVGEKGVKTRIEQMTQRTRNVEPFDSLSITRIQPPLRGFDLRVDSYLNFELNFDVLYNVLDNLTKKINSKTNTILNAATIGSNAISSVSQSITQGAQQGVDNVNINTQGNINIQGYKEPDMVDPSVLRNDLQKEITALKHSEYGNDFSNQIANVENTITRKSNIKANTAGVQQATKALEGLLKRTSDTLEQHKKASQQYDTFLQQINSSFLINNSNDIEGNITTSLYTADEQVVETIKHAEHPMKTYINMQENIVDGFVNALKNNSPEKLNMGQFTYDKLSTYFNGAKQKITEAKGYIQYQTPVSTPIKTITNTTIDTVQTFIAPNVEAASPSIPLSPSNMTNIWWDEHSIYTNQTTYLQKKSDGTTFTRFYDFEPISKYSDFADRVDEQGYISRYNTAFNVWNFYTPITHFEVVGQSNTTTNVRWQNDGRRAYLIMLSDKIYANHEHNYSRDIQRKYVIAYDSGFDLQNSFIDIPTIGLKRVYDLIGSDVISTPTFEPTDTDIDIMLSLTGNKWSYASITPLMVNSRGSVTEISLGAAWSTQETLGVQRWGDTTSPVATAKIRNKRTNQIIAEGTKLTVPRNEQYDLIIQWTDDGVVLENSVIDSTNAMQTFNGDSATLENIYTTKTINIIATARDQSNNQGTQTIVVAFTDPAIAIQTVSDQGDQREIGTALSEVYPNGYVRFFSQKPVGNELLTGRQGSQDRTDFDTNDTQSLTGKIFYDADTISLFDINKKRVARIEKKTGKITVEQAVKDIITLALDFTQNTPSILIIDKVSNSTLFSLYLKSIRLQNIQSTHGFTVVSLNDTVGTFAGGSCIQDNNNICVVFITADGNIYTPDTQKGRVAGTYTYDGGIRYNITIDGRNAATITFTPMALE